MHNPHFIFVGKHENVFVFVFHFAFGLLEPVVLILNCLRVLNENRGTLPVNAIGFFMAIPLMGLGGEGGGGGGGWTTSVLGLMRMPFM